MIDWWFGWINDTEQYNHATTSSSAGRAPGTTTVHTLVDITSSKKDFLRTGYSTAICGRVGNWNDETGEVTYIGHLVHLIKDEPDGVRMRSRFWLSDIPGLAPEHRRAAVPGEFALGLLQHATEEMAILATILLDLYARHKSATSTV
ncbi:hypothetical protein BDW75DRAFT_242674 [Aspergillus navahoensis]